MDCLRRVNSEARHRFSAEIKKTQDPKKIEELKKRVKSLNNKRKKYSQLYSCRN